MFGEDDEEPLGGSYTGMTQQGLRHGTGTYRYANSYFTYEGSWHKGVKHGKGKFTLGDGSVFEGDFALGEIEGWGTRTWPSGASYSGQFHLGEMHGTGTRVEPDGSIYEGAWVANAKHGQGKLTAADGSVYEGTFAHNRRTGWATLVDTDGTRYEGEFIDASKEGSGTQSWPDGSTYEGAWVRSAFHGQGTYRVGGRVYAGEWESGRAVQLPHSMAVAEVILPVESAPASDGAEAEPAQARRAKSVGKRAGMASKRPAAVPITDQKPLLTLTHGGDCPTIIVKFEAADGSTASAESGRLIRATLRRYSVPEAMVVDKKDKGGKKGKPQPPAAAPAAAPELLLEVVVGEALSASGLATLNALNVPAQAGPSSDDREYELTLSDETPPSVLLGTEPLEPIRQPCKVVHAPGATPATAAVKAEE